ncbi:hypothetical protein ACQPZX_22360 [Actinoplanes sp. CA-142083]|uniref:hypothetical protein n=1 Tax=Actinoplanes sp. CA-142083 TaxID=3239903 RepID=UPI003D8F4158
MTLLHDRPAAADARQRPQRRSAAAAAVAVAAAVALLVAGPPTTTTPAPAGRVDAAQAWPKAQRADFDPVLPDGPLFTPLLFLDTTTALGTAPTPDARWVRLMLWTKPAATPRELRRLPLESNPQFEAATAAGDDLVWTESTDNKHLQIWHARRSGGSAALLTTDTGDALFYGNSFDLVVADGRVHWAAAAKDRKLTDIRSAPMAGGDVDIRSEQGEWALSTWPWLVDEQEARLRNLSTSRDAEVVTSGPELATCGPVWCRVMVMGGEGLARIDLMHPDGSERRRIAGGGAQAAVTDVAVLDRFELLAEAGPDADVTGTATLLAYDTATARTVAVAKEVDGTFTSGGMLWWSTGDDDSITWHALDLRTI